MKLIIGFSLATRVYEAEAWLMTVIVISVFRGESWQRHARSASAVK